MRLGLQRVPEEDQEVDHPFDNLASDLLVTAQGAALQAHHAKVQLLAEQASRCSGRVQLVTREGAAVEAGPFQKVLFLVVVRDECDPLCRICEQFLIRHAPVYWRTATDA